MFALSVYSPVNKIPTDYSDALFLQSLTGNGPLQEDSGSKALPVYTMRILGLGFVKACSFPDPQQVYLPVATQAVQGVQVIFLSQ